MNKIINEDILEIANENLPWEQLNGKTILITGARSYLALYIIYVILYRNDLYDCGTKIIALCRDEEKSKQCFGMYKKRDDFSLLCQDVAENISDKYRADIILHAASPTSPYINEKKPYSIIEANVIGYHNLLNKYKIWNSEKILLFSSGTVYGNNTPIEGVNEDYRDKIDFADYQSCYKFAKQMSEMMTACKLKEDSKYNISIARPFIVYGPGQGYSQRKFFTDFLKNFLCSEDIILKSNGEGIRSYIYIKDAIKGIFYVLLKGKNGEAYNVTSTKDICSIKELAEIFCKFNKKLNIKYQISNESYLNLPTKIFVGKNDKLLSLGWKDETSLKEGIWRTICWAKDSDFLEKKE